jgi:hypothetical protein
MWVIRGSLVLESELESELQSDWAARHEQLPDDEGAPVQRGWHEGEPLESRAEFEGAVCGELRTVRRAHPPGGITLDRDALVRAPERHGPVAIGRPNHAHRNTLHGTDADCAADA